jgi:hypothetical protein
MNKRVQITIDPDTRERAQAQAEKLGISFAEFARRALQGALEPPREKPDISVFFDLVKDGPVTNIARDKDKMIAEAAWEEHRRSIGASAKRARTGSKPR